MRKRIANVEYALIYLELGLGRSENAVIFPNYLTEGHKARHVRFLSIAVSRFRERRVLIAKPYKEVTQNGFEGLQVRNDRADPLRMLFWCHVNLPVAEPVITLFPLPDDASSISMYKVGVLSERICGLDRVCKLDA
jgi:hypothetical protein